MLRPHGEMLQDGREVSGGKQLALGAAAVGVAFATMTYELTLAQTLTSIYGGTITSYSLVIGVFVLSLGLGAAYWAWAGHAASARNFWKLEMILAALGIVAPACVFRAEFGGADALAMGFAATVLMAVAIGAFAGMEIPLLVAMATKQGSRGAVSVVIGLDFIGTFVASVLVPLWMFPELGLVGSALVGSFVNVAAAVLVLGSQREFKPAWTWLGLSVVAAAAAFALSRAVAIESYLAKGVF